MGTRAEDLAHMVAIASNHDVLLKENALLREQIETYKQYVSELKEQNNTLRQLVENLSKSAV